MNWLVFSNSLVLAGLTALVAGVFGFAVALWLSTLSARWRKLFLALAIIALVMPPFLVTNCWLDLLGNNGPLQRWFPLNIYSLAGAVGLLASLLWPITTLLTLAAWKRLEPSQLESDPRLRGAALLRWLLWPMARVAVGQAALLTFVLALNNFAVPVILQVRVFPEEMWLAFTTRLNEQGAWAAAWPLVLAPLLVLALLRRAEIAWPRFDGTAAAWVIRRQLGGGWLWTSGGVAFLLLALSVGLPLTQLVASKRTWAELPNLCRAAPDVIWNSIALAAVPATLCLALGLLTWRLRGGPILWLSFLVPGVLLGRVMISVFNGTMLYGTILMVMLAFAVRYVAPVWHGAAQALRSVDRDLTDAARLDGASGWTLLRRVQWPQIAPQVGAAWYVTYLLCLWDVETLVLIQPPGGETLALRIFNLLHYGHHGQVNAMCVLLLGLALAPMGVWSAYRWIRLKAG
jgi:iron(III) transport system permease protein